MKPYLFISKLLLFTLGCIIFSFVSCNVQKDLDKIDLSKVLASAHPSEDTLSRHIGKNLILGAGDGSKIAIKDVLSGLKGSIDTLNPDLKKLLHAINLIGDTTSFQIRKIGDTLQWQIGRMKGNIKFFKETLTSITATLNEQTRNILSNMIQSTLDSLKTPASKAKIDSIISNLLDKNTTAKVQGLVGNALQPTIDTITNRVDRIVHKDIPFVQKQAVFLLVMLALLAAGIIGFVWYQKRKYSKLTQLLTYQIDKVKSQPVYDELTSSIASQSKREALEPLLKKVLRGQGIND